MFLSFAYRPKFTLIRKVVSSVMTFAFLTSLSTPAGAQLASLFPVPGSAVTISPIFVPPTLKGLNIHPENPFLFDFIVGRGDDKIQGTALKAESEKLVKFFLTAMTIPDKEAWVNLSPYEANRIIPDALGKTEMGKVMLEQDYLLKQLASSLTNPDTDLGKKFWSNVRTKAKEKFGTTEIPMSTFNKVWIVPAKAEVAEKDGKVFITQNRLKVMLEEDYDAMQRNISPTAEQNLTPPNPLFKKEGERGDNSVTLSSNKTKSPLTSSLDKTKSLLPPSLDKEGLGGVLKEPVASDMVALSSQVFRSTILPSIEKEINEGKNFAAVRQIYDAAILAVWYKSALKESLLGKIYADKSKVKGIETDAVGFKEEVYKQYVAAFKKGAYNMIKEDFDMSKDESVPTRYFSGGVVIPGAIGIKKGGVAASAVEADDVDVRAQLTVNNSEYYRVATIADTVAASAVTHDPRPAIIRELRKVLPSEFTLYPGGFASIDVMPKVDKNSAMQEIFKGDFQLEVVYYFGNEFYATDKKTGNDTPVLQAQREINKEIKIISLDEKAEDRTQVAKESTTWLGAGPHAGIGALEAIASALENSKDSLILRGAGEDSSKRIEINLNQLRVAGAMYFDVDGTILDKKVDNFQNQKAIREVFSRLLSQGIRLGIISGNSRVEQSNRILTPLANQLATLADIKNLTLYVNGGATKVEFDNQANPLVTNLVNPISPEIFEKIQTVVSQMAQLKFGLSAEEISVWKQWMNFDGQFGTRTDFPNVKFNMSWDNPNFSVDLVNAEDISGAQNRKDPLVITLPFIENRDGMQISVKPLPKQLDIPAKSAASAVEKNFKKSAKELSDILVVVDGEIREYDAALLRGTLDQMLALPLRELSLKVLNNLANSKDTSAETKQKLPGVIKLIEQLPYQGEDPTESALKFDNVEEMIINNTEIINALADTKWLDSSPSPSVAGSSPLTGLKKILADMREKVKSDKETVAAIANRNATNQRALNNAALSLLKPDSKTGIAPAKNPAQAAQMALDEISPADQLFLLFAENVKKLKDSGKSDKDAIDIALKNASINQARGDLQQALGDGVSKLSDAEILEIYRIIDTAVATKTLEGKVRNLADILLAVNGILENQPNMPILKAVQAVAASTVIQSFDEWLEGYATERFKRTGESLEQVQSDLDKNEKRKALLVLKWAAEQVKAATEHQKKVQSDPTQADESRRILDEANHQLDAAREKAREAIGYVGYLREPKDDNVLIPTLQNKVEEFVLRVAELPVAQFSEIIDVQKIQGDITSLLKEMIADKLTNEDDPRVAQLTQLINEGYAVLNRIDDTASDRQATAEDQRVTHSTEEAMLAGQQKSASSQVGGINFDPTLMNLQVKRDKNGVPLPLPQQDLKNINIEGLYPVIINIAPATLANFPLLSKAEEEKQRIPSVKDDISPVDRQKLVGRAG